MFLRCQVEIIEVKPSCLSIQINASLGGGGGCQEAKVQISVLNELDILVERYDYSFRKKI